MCKYGCGKPGVFPFKKGGFCCSKHYTKCSVIAKKIGDKSGKTRRENPIKRSEEFKAELSIKFKQQWADGRRKFTPAMLANSKNIRQYVSPIPWNKGKKNTQIPWNKGLKSRQKEPVDGENVCYKNFKKYRDRITVRTKTTYLENKEKLNPNNFPLGRCGVVGAYQIDHIISVKDGFEQQISVEQMSSVENLQIIPWLDNLKKYYTDRRKKKRI